MKISLQELYDMNACKEGIERFQLQTNGMQESVDVATLVGGHNTYADLLWLASKTFSRRRLVKLACDCALIVVEDLKPHVKDYDAAVSWLKNPTPTTTFVKTTKYSHAFTAYSAAYSAARVRDVDYSVEFVTDYIDSAIIAVNNANELNQSAVNALLVQLFNEVA